MKLITIDWRQVHVSLDVEPPPEPSPEVRAALIALAKRIEEELLLQIYGGPPPKPTVLELEPRPFGLVNYAPTT